MSQEGTIPMWSPVVKEDLPPVTQAWATTTGFRHTPTEFVMVLAGDLHEEREWRLVREVGNVVRVIGRWPVTDTLAVPPLEAATQKLILTGFWSPDDGTAVGESADGEIDGERVLLVDETVPLLLVAPAEAVIPLDLVTLPDPEPAVIPGRPNLAQLEPGPQQALKRRRTQRGGD